MLAAAATRPSLRWTMGIMWSNFITSLCTKVVTAASACLAQANQLGMSDLKSAAQPAALLDNTRAN